MNILLKSILLMLLFFPFQFLLAALLQPKYQAVYSTSHVTTSVGVASPVTAHLTAGDLFGGGKKKDLGSISQPSDNCIYVTDKKAIKEHVDKCCNFRAAALDNTVKTDFKMYKNASLSTDVTEFFEYDAPSASKYFSQRMESKEGVEIRITPIMPNHKMHRVIHPRIVEGQVMSELTNGLEPIAYVACEHGHKDPRHAACNKGVWIRSWLLDHPGNIKVRKVTIKEEPQDDGGMIIRFTKFENETHQIDIYTYDDNARKGQQYKGLEVHINTGVLLNDGVNPPGHNPTAPHNAGLYNAVHNPVTYLAAAFLMLSTIPVY